jgi:hypothetical protein
MRPVTSATGIADQANTREVPSAESSSDSTSSDISPAAAVAIARAAQRVVVDDDLEERATDDVLVRPSHSLLERVVGADLRVVGVAVADRPVGCERDHDARHRLEHRGLDVALPLELDLPPASLRDVHAARDDRESRPVLVEERRRAPVHDPVSPRRFLKAFSYSPAELRRERRSARSRRLAR